MVLQELGAKLTSALRRLHGSTVIDNDVLDEVLKDITRALVEADVNIRLVAELKKNVKSKVNLTEPKPGLNVPRLVQHTVMAELTAILEPGTPPYQMKRRGGGANVIMFVGLQGAGKTTTIAKYAHYYQRKGWKVAMVCADTFRAGAFDQLKQNATKLRCPYYGSYTEADPARIAEEGVAQFRADKYDVIIVDTSGRHKQEDALFEEMQEIQAAVRPDNIVFVMDATQGQAVHEQAKAFHEAVPVGSVIITKLDGHAKGGGALSAVAATKSPIAFLGAGERFDDLEPFEAKAFVGRLLGFGDMKGFMRELGDSVDKEDQKEMMERMTKGQFTLRDMCGQFKTVMKLGPMSKWAGMLPGMPTGLMPAGMEAEGGMRLKRFMFMMDSMTADELDGKVDISASPSRIRRIARGSGTLEVEVEMLLKTHRNFERMVSKMGKSGMMKGAQDPQAMQRMMAMQQRNPQAMQRQLAASGIDPRMLQQMQQSMGGMGGMGGMSGPGGGMGGMGGGGGVPSMAQVMQMMQGMNPRQMEEMAAQMGMGGMMDGGGGSGGGMPDMAALAQMMGGMGIGGMGGGPGGGRSGGRR